MPLPRFAISCVIACVLLCLSGCMTSGAKRWKERAEGCDQPRAEVPAWPASEFEAYAIELLGVIADDRTRTRIERECRAGL